MVDLGWVWVSMGLGLLSYCAVPWLAAPALSDDKQKRIGDTYYWLAMTALQQAKLVRRRLGGYAITRYSYDAEKQGAKISLDDTQHIRDEDNRMARLYNNEFGLAIEGVPMVVDAELAELGEHYGDHTRFGEDVTETIERDDQGHITGRTRAVNPYFEVPPGLRLADPLEALNLIPGGADASDPATAKEFTDKSQEGFRSRLGAAESLATIFAFLAAFGAVTFVHRYFYDAATGGGGIPESPIPIGGTLYVPPSHLVDLTTQFVVMLA